jgi:hypothetical protein
VPPRAAGAVRDVAAGDGNATGGPAKPASTLPTELQWIAAGCAGWAEPNAAAPASSGTDVGSITPLQQQRFADDVAEAIGTGHVIVVVDLNPRTAALPDFPDFSSMPLGMDLLFSPVAEQPVCTERSSQDASPTLRAAGFWKSVGIPACALPTAAHAGTWLAP